jgi:hypothetical protein
LRVRAVQRKIEARGERSGSRDKESRDNGDRRSEGSEGDNSNVSKESGSETGREVGLEEEEVGGSERFGSQEAGEEEEEEVGAEGGQGEEVEEEGPGEEDKDVCWFKDCCKLAKFTDKQKRLLDKIQESLDVKEGEDI